jgi:hypothetical protein
VIVLDNDHLQLLTERGAFPRILEAEIRAVEEATGLSRFNEGSNEMTEVDLPSHLSTYMKNTN